MRGAFFLASFLLLSPGCASECAPASQMDGQVYRVFGSFLSVDSRKTDLDAVEASPVNGEANWQFAWTSEAGAITVFIDGQSFEGVGEWDLVECGMFTTSFEGTYESDAGSRHSFSASGDFLTHDETLEGWVSWIETWQAGELVGRITGQAQLRGERVGSR